MRYYRLKLKQKGMRLARKLTYYVKKSIIYLAKPNGDAVWY